MNLINELKLDRVSKNTAAGTTDITSDSIDMQNFEGAMFMVHMGTLVAGGTISVEVETSTDDSSFTALKGTKVAATADTADDKLLVVEITKPLERYLRVVVKRATQNSEVDSIMALQYGPKKLAVTQSADVDASELHVSPARGAA